MNDDPFRSSCAACGAWYDPGDADQSERHVSHGGDAGLPRAALLGLVDGLQRQRDELWRALLGAGDVLARVAIDDPYAVDPADLAEVVGAERAARIVDG